MDRAILVELERISDTRRRTEAAIMADFTEAHPSLLGVLLDAASAALRNEPTTHLSAMPRMADFSRWVEAGAPGFGWEPSHFLDAYRANRASADEIAVDASPVGAAIAAFMTDRETWLGTASDLLAALNERVIEKSRDKGWPKQAHTLSGHLKRVAPNLGRLGLDIELGVRLDRNSRRGVRIMKGSADERPRRTQGPFPHNGADCSDESSDRVASAQSPQDLHEYPGNDADSWHDEGAVDAADGADPLLHNSSQAALFDVPEPDDPDRYTW
jgi:hypothetical protein